MRRLLIGLGVSVALVLGTVSFVAAQDEAPHCPPGVEPHYVFGFKALHDNLGPLMGDPLTCEFADPNGTGDVHQVTTEGLAFWRKSTNTPTFTNGWEHWAITDAGLVFWLGESIDPIPEAVPVPPPVTQPAPDPEPAPPPVTPGPPPAGPAPDAFYHSFLDSQQLQLGQREDADVTGDGQVETLLMAYPYLCAGCLFHFFVFSGQEQLLYMLVGFGSGFELLPGEGFAITQADPLPGEPRLFPSYVRTDHYVFDPATRSFVVSHTDVQPVPR